MVSDRNSSTLGKRNPSSGFSGGMVAASFIGAFAALVVVTGLDWVLDLDKGVLSEPTGTSLALSVAGDGLEEFVSLGTVETSATLTFEEAGTYRIELRGLDGTSDPVLSLFRGSSTTATATNDDTDGLDAMVPVRIEEPGEGWRLDLTSYGETGGPGVLRVLPAPEGLTIPAKITEGPGGFPADAKGIEPLELNVPAVSQMSPDGSWYTFSPGQSGTHIIAVRAADGDLDTVASLLPVLPGSEVPASGTDITAMPAAFTSDDDDGLNPRFARYLQQGASYYLFVRGFDETADGSFAVTASFQGDEPSPQVEDTLNIEEDQDLPVVPHQSDQQNSNKN